jgi:hypothetical protein
MSDSMRYDMTTPYDGGEPDGCEMIAAAIINGKHNGI